MPSRQADRRPLDQRLEVRILGGRGHSIAPGREPSGSRRLARGTTLRRGRDLRRGSRGRAPGRAPCGPARCRGSARVRCCAASRRSPRRRVRRPRPFAPCRRSPGRRWWPALNSANAASIWTTIRPSSAPGRSSRGSWRTVADSSLLAQTWAWAVRAVDSLAGCQISRLLAISCGPRIWPTAATSSLCLFPTWQRRQDSRGRSSAASSREPLASHLISTC